ncbi:hypothetical protein [Parabacteroides distasonis]|uniref:hypothetical protein n=1 Tax=Parabacteroides distasonis TaxID=823 RepID=UPI003F1EC242
MIYTKSMITLLVILLLTSCNNNQHSEFKGNIESISEKTYSCSEKFGEIIKEELIEGSSYTFKDNKVSKFELYDKDGEKIFSNSIEYKNKKPISVKIIRREFDSNTSDYIQVEEVESFLEKDSQTEKWLKIRNNISDTIFCKLDKGGEICFRKEKNSEGNTQISEYTRNKNKYIIETKISVNNKLEFISKVQFDENNFECKRENEYLKHENYQWKDIMKYKYQIDDTGNWIERITYDKNDKPTKITIREIKYN